MSIRKRLTSDFPCATTDSLIDAVNDNPEVASISAHLLAMYLSTLTTLVDNQDNVRRFTTVLQKAIWANDETRHGASTVLQSLGWYNSAPLSPGFVYILKAGPFYKIGKTKQPNNRIKSIATQMPFEIVPIAIIPTLNDKSLEKMLHTAFRLSRANGEWFTLSSDDLQSILYFPSGFYGPDEAELVIRGLHKRCMSSMKKAARTWQQN